jgi:hypothetical protein
MTNPSDSYGNYPRQNGMRPIRVTLAAGVPQRFQRPGDWIAAITAPVNDLTVRFDNSEKVPLPQGLGFRSYYGEIELESATGQAVVVLAGFGSVSDSRANVTATLNVNIAPGNTIDDGADVAVPSGVATVIKTVDLTRLHAIICNPSTNTASFRIGSSTVTAAKGILLEPGETLIYDMTGAIYAFQASGSAATISAAAVRSV